MNLSTGDQRYTDANTPQRGSGGRGTSRRAAAVGGGGAARQRVAAALGRRVHRGGCGRRRRVHAAEVRGRRRVHRRDRGPARGHHEEMIMQTRPILGAPRPILRL